MSQSGHVQPAFSSRPLYPGCWPAAAHKVGQEQSWVARRRQRDVHRHPKERRWVCSCPEHFNDRRGEGSRGPANQARELVYVVEERALRSCRIGIRK
jgi:hypothetical protein